MYVHEYDSKLILRRYGIPVNLGDVAITPEDAENIAHVLGGDVYVKAQILRVQRARLNGIKRAETPEDARVIASRMLGESIDGYRVCKVLIDPTIRIKRELYLSITYDRYHAKEVFMASLSGGIGVTSRGETIYKEYIDPLMGLHRYQIVRIANNIELSHEYWSEFIDICHNLYTCYRESDATLLEINPLAITENDHLIAIDAKLTVDDNALFRQPALAELRDTSGEPISVTMARNAGIQYVKLDGQIGCMVNGAGLAMTTMDMIDYYGSDFGVEAANFIDLGGGPKPEKVANGLRIILADEKVECIILNIFGGTTRCDDVARGVVEVYESLRPEIPLIIRMKGTNAEKGYEIIRAAAESESSVIPMIIGVNTLTEAARKAVYLVKAKVHG